MRTHNALSDPQREERLRRIEKRRREQFDADLVTLMGHDWGRRLVYAFVYEVCDLQGDAYDGAKKYGISEAMARYTGQQAVGRFLLGKVQELSHELHLEMVREQSDARRAELALEMPTQPAEGDT